MSVLPEIYRRTFRAATLFLTQSIQFYRGTYTYEYLYIPTASTTAWPDQLPHERTNADTPPLAVEGCVDNDERRPVYVLVAASYAEARCPRLGRTELR